MTMDIVFEKNMEVLAKRYPKLSKRVRETKDSPSFKLIQAKNGMPNVLIKKGSDLLTLYDNDDPVKYCDDYLERLDLKYAPIVIFMGLGLVHHLDRYFKLIGVKVGTREAVVFEKDIELFRLALKVIDFRNFISNSHIHFFVGESPEESFIRLTTEIFSEKNTGIALKSLKVIPFPGSIILDKQYYKRIFLTIKKSVRQVLLSEGNDPLDSFFGLENLLKNIRNVVSNPGINRLFGKFKGRPGVIVAAGPSLNKNLHLLKGIRDKALIISCDSSFMPIMNKGIQPHMVTSLERTPHVEHFFSDIQNFDGVYFIALPMLAPEVLDVFKGKKFIADRGFSHFDWLEEEKGSVRVGISVSNLAFRIMVELRCNPIILIGQDLAYAEDGDTHVKGNPFGSRDDIIIESPIIELEGNDGTLVKSEKLWEIMKYTYETDIKAYKGKCINATEGGAKILGAEVMPFKQAITSYCTEEFKPHLILDDAYSKFKGSVNLKEKLERIQEKAKKSPKILEDSIKQFEDALLMANRAEKQIIQPFLEGSLKEVDIDGLKSIEKRFLDLSESFSNDKIVWDLMSHTLNSYDVIFSNQMGFLRDIYTDERYLAIARSRMIKEWFSIVGQFLVLTKCLLEKTEKALNEEIALAM